ncbi:hypothetical protein ACJ4V0_19625 [Phreatobacter sp. HK31-P]
MALVTKVLAGLLIWTIGFSVLYALHGFGCAAGWGAIPVGPLTALSATLIATWLLFVGLGLAWAIILYRSDGMMDSGFLRTIGLVSALAGLGGLVFTGAPVLLPAHCL